MCEQLQELGSVEGRPPADDLLNLPHGDLAHGIVMGYAHHLCVRPYGPVQVEGMGHHHLIPGEACLQKGCLNLAHAAGGEGGRAVCCRRHGRAEEFMKDKIGQGSFGHDGGKAQHHSAVVAAHHGLVAGENYLLALRGWHHLPHCGSGR
ncbi:MAG: hypothetical protein LUQ02_00280 [Methanothrix sp.]|nr:hypothetical protein [Methanothrix sp.]